MVAAGDALVELIDLVDIRYRIDGSYSGLPEGRYAIHQAWSGDLVNSQYYWPGGVDLGDDPVSVAGQESKDRPPTGRSRTTP